jgi:hypothetical protein
MSKSCSSGGEKTAVEGDWKGAPHLQVSRPDLIQLNVFLQFGQ